MAAAANDIIGLADARVAAGYSMTDPSKDQRLQWLVSAVSDRIDELCGPVVQRSVTERLNGGGHWVKLRRHPVSAVTSVAEYLTGAASVLTAETVSAAGGYLAEVNPDDNTQLTGRIFRRVAFADSWFPPGRQNVVVVATAGRYATTALASASRFGQAARFAVKASWAGELNAVQNLNEFDLPQASYPSVIIPKVSLDLLADQIQYAGMA